MDEANKVELPASFEDAQKEHLADLIADMLERLMNHNDRIPLAPESLTRFHSRSAPAITVGDYLRRIIKFTNVEKSCLLITLHYIDQICTRQPLFIFSSLTCHRFIIISIVVSSKGLCDSFCANSLYAKVGGIPIMELNLLEREFLHIIDWRLTCTRDVLQQYYINLVQNSTRFIIAGGEDGAGGTSDSDFDIEFDSSGQSRSTSPVDSLPHRRHRRQPTATEASAILVDPPTPTHVPRKPTMEQNMAFAALQESWDTSSASTQE